MKTRLTYEIIVGMTKFSALNGDGYFNSHLLTCKAKSKQFILRCITQEKSLLPF